MIPLSYTKTSYSSTARVQKTTLTKWTKAGIHTRRAVALSGTTARWMCVQLAISIFAKSPSARTNFCPREPSGMRAPNEEIEDAAVEDMERFEASVANVNRKFRAISFEARLRQAKQHSHDTKYCGRKRCTVHNAHHITWLNEDNSSGDREKSLSLKNADTSELG